MPVVRENPKKKKIRVKLILFREIFRRRSLSGRKRSMQFSQVLIDLSKTAEKGRAGEFRHSKEQQYDGKE